MFIVDIPIGKALIAVPSEGTEEDCFGCIFNDANNDCVIDCLGCTKASRKDGTDVVFQLIDLPK